MLRVWPLALLAFVAALPSLAVVGGDGQALLRAEVAAPSSRSRLADDVAPVLSRARVKHVAPHRADRIAVLPNGHALVVHETSAHEETKTASRHASLAVVEALAPNISHIAAETSNTTAMGVAKKPPNHLYFGIGVGVFFLALLLMALTMKKMNYLEDDARLTTDEASSSSAANPQGEEDEPARRPSAASTNPRHPGDYVPFRMQQVLIAWVSIIASVAYFLDFLCLQADMNRVRHWFGAVASLLWVLGFLIHLHWQVSVGGNLVQMLSSFFKVLACVMGQVHPFSMIMGSKETDPGVWWPAVAGIASWHIGNIIGSIDYFVRPPLGSNRRLGWFSHGNLALTEMWVDLGATWMLLYASAATTMWWGLPEKQLLPTQNMSVVFCQFGGATLFLAASCIRCEWCNGFQNCSHSRPVDSEILERQQS